VVLKLPELPPVAMVLHVPPPELELLEEDELEELLLLDDELELLLEELLLEDELELLLELELLEDELELLLDEDELPSRTVTKAVSSITNTPSETRILGEYWPGISKVWVTLTPE
jgi:hypothetical protein